MRTAKSTEVEQEIFEKQVLICKAFANATRLRILDLLGKREWKASELQKHLGISQANLSQHVGILKSAGVIVRKRRNKDVVFSLAMPQVRTACHLIRSVLRAQIRNSRRYLE